MPIRVLAPEVVNQIAAGEVVERPASVVKELVENSIDAGATRVRIRIVGGGRDLIEVVDDGAGIPAEELPLAVEAHATSKLARAEDLARISTLGFRGEALASIGSVSRLEIVSRPRSQSEAARIEVDGGRVVGPMPASGPPGTIVRVRTLFANIPARRRFLRSEQAEAGRVTELIEAISLAHPGVAFRLESGDRTVLDLAPTRDRRQRVEALLGEELVPDLLTVEHEGGLEGAGEIRVWGVVARPSASRASGRHQRLYVNSRAIVDRSLLHAVKEAFRGVIDPARYPVAVLQIEIDPAEVDVNVHPTKSEVRFRQPSAVHSFLLQAVRGALRAADLVPTLDLGARAWPGREAWTAEGARGHGDAAAPPSKLLRSSRSSPGFDHQVLQRALSATPSEPPAALPTLERVPGVLQLHQAYLVFQDSEGLVIVDQHALHERVLYEEMLSRIMGGSLERQMLLAPMMIEVGAKAAERLDSLSPLLDRLGFDAGLAGPRTVVVHAVPSFLASRRVDAGEFLAELLDSDMLPDALPDERPSESAPGNLGASEAAIHRVIDMMACKAAVKAGERLTQEEISRLLAARERVERSTNCPHGRPTTLRIPLRDLERHFGRA